VYKWNYCYRSKSRSEPTIWNSHYPHLGHVPLLQPLIKCSLSHLHRWVHWVWHSKTASQLLIEHSGISEQCPLSGTLQVHSFWVCGYNQQNKFDEWNLVFGKTQSNKVSKTGCSKNKKPHVIGCESIDIKADVCPLTIDNTADICRELHEQCIAAWNGKPPQSTKAWIHPGLEVEHQD